MASYLVHMIGQRQPINLDLPFSDIEDLMAEASYAKFLVGHLTAADENGIFQRVMISTYRIECVVGPTD
jgi:hypothetical protein